MNPTLPPIVAAFLVGVLLGGGHWLILLLLAIGVAAWGHLCPR